MCVVFVFLVCFFFAAGIQPHFRVLLTGNSEDWKRKKTKTYRTSRRWQEGGRNGPGDGDGHGGRETNKNVRDKKNVSSLSLSLSRVGDSSR